MRKMFAIYSPDRSFSMAIRPTVFGIDVATAIVGQWYSTTDGYPVLCFDANA